MHPLQGGILRKKTRFQRRSTLPVEPIWQFYSKMLTEFARKTWLVTVQGWRIYRIYRRVASDPAGMQYTDQAMMPVADDDVENLELFTQNSAARKAVDHARKVKELTHSAA